MALLEKMLALVAPHSCLVCGREGKLLCEWCANDAFVEIPSRCYRCKRVTTNSACCDKCKKLSPLRHVWVRCDYSGVAKQLLWLLKFERAQSASAELGEAMIDALPYLAADTLVVPVPTATSRVRQRGYDQSMLLARHIAIKRNYQWLRAVTHIGQARQMGANRQKRLHQLQETFVVVKPLHVKGRHILIVDDVVTTGASLETMAKVLKRAGAKSVDALVFAQKQ